ncbi:lipase family protein [Nocardia transvalensis]|uniref:lipase family protein n=1 Tax=Nocardia transvalensis TaxID=37333 RepID=UPI0018945A9C|nr:lipase family protein [Nocardia transvalensis]MBF6329103.1 lipase [Nocardia transvalensis]
MRTAVKRRSSALRRFSHATLALFGALALTWTGVGTARADLVPPAPQSDPFYQPPADFVDTAPGTVLRSRPVEVTLPVPASAWQLLYRTTDVDGRPDATVTTVLLPKDARENRPLVADQAYENSSGPTCVTSYQLRLPNTPANAAAMQIPDITEELQRGWAVSVADFEGRQGHFAVAREPGYMILDGIRAAEHFAPLGLNEHTRVGLFGNSGGGLATGWAAQMQPQYAPEINLAGVAMGSPVPQPALAVENTNGTVSSGLAGAVLASLADAYPDFGAAVRAHMSPEGVGALDTLRSQCLILNNFRYMFTDWQRYLNLPMDQFFALPEVARVLDDITLGTPAPTAPLYLYQGMRDEVVPVATTDRLVEQYCTAGTPVTYLHDLGADHYSIGDRGRIPSDNWLAGRLDSDAPAPTGCSTTDVAQLS